MRYKSGTVIKFKTEVREYSLLILMGICVDLVNFTIVDIPGWCLTIPKGKMPDEVVVWRHLSDFYSGGLGEVQRPETNV